jgi:hypothetical protein
MVGTIQFWLNADVVPSARPEMTSYLNAIIPLTTVWHDRHRTSGEPSSQLHERHDASDFDTNRELTIRRQNDIALSI